jgi:hypothetical protein
LKEEGIILELKVLIMSSDIEDFKFALKVFFIPISFILYKNILKWEYNEAVHQLSVDFKKAYDSVRREVLYNILIEFGIPLKSVRLVKMCL